LRVLLIANPDAGGAGDVSIEELSAALAPLGEVTTSEGGGDASIVRDAEGAELVVVAGGDGSLNLAVNALAERLDELVLAVIPLGTGNDLARTLGLPDEPLAAAAGLTAGTQRSIDLGRVTGGSFERLFLNACMGGFPVRVDEAVDERTKELLGPAAFWWGGLKAATGVERTDVMVNGAQVRDCVAVGVGNGRTAGGGIELWPDALLDDRLLDFVVLPAATNAAAVKLALKTKNGSHRELDDVVHGRSDRVRIESTDPVPFNVDGELFDLSTPLTFEIAGSVRMLMPSD
jgi:diacylglycerol kinase (ATP)